MAAKAERRFTAAASIAEAVAARGRGAHVLAGGTWVMRDPRRGVDLPEAVVTLSHIPGLAQIAIGPDEVSIGALVTHAALSAGLHGVPGLAALAAAANGAANPAIRRAATAGGNLCATGFAAADLVPALLVLDAGVELATSAGPKRVGMVEFLRAREAHLAGAVLARILVPRTTARSAHVRLPLRKAGDYPVAIVSVAVDEQARWRVAVGSVEAQARRWTALEQALAAEPEGRVAPERAGALAAAHNDFRGRDGIEADGWYRCQVLRTLVRRAVAALGGSGRA